MKIVVAGLWHLGCVTAACCARYFRVTGFDFDSDTVNRLNQGKAPLFEPGLDDLIGSGIRTGNLDFTAEPTVACEAADVLWLTFDTPVDENDESDIAFVLEKLRWCLAHLPVGALVLISSQLPVGTSRKLEKEFPQFSFAYSPENLRLGRALDAFEKADRVVIGARDDSKKAMLKELFDPFTKTILWMRTESAEMVKHGLNSFLALSITFINEVARLCEQVGADAKDVSIGLKSDPRIGARAYLGPGGAFAGGTLARDVVTLMNLAAAKDEPISVIPAIKASNDLHKNWAFRKLKSHLKILSGKSIGILGLTYTPNTDTLRRSLAVELVEKLIEEGASVKAFDPAVKVLPQALSRVRLMDTLEKAILDVDAVVIGTEWPEFREADWKSLISKRSSFMVLDANRFLEKQMSGLPTVRYISVGSAI